jgi:SAM-dependent methyltransferase
VAKRTGKTHENLERELNQLTPPPTARRPAPPVELPPTRSSVARQPRNERSGPIGISGGDFATPSSRKRTTTQPRGIPIVAAPPAAPRIGTPHPVPQGDGGAPDAPFAAAGFLGDAASQLAAEAAAVRALDSGALTPPPSLDDPGPTPPPELASAPPTPAIEDHRTPVSAVEDHRTPVSAVEDHRTPAPAVEDHRTPASEAVAAPVDTASPPIEASAELAAPATPVPGLDAPVPDGSSDDPQPEAFPLVAAAESEGEASEDHFSAQETPWPELAQQGAVLREPTPTPVPGAIPTDAMGGDSGAGLARQSEDAELAGADELEVVDGSDGAEALDALPAEALADADLAPEVAPPPAPRAAVAPPPIPAGSPRRKTGEVRAPEVPTAQVLASIVPAGPSGASTLPEALAQRPRRPKRSKPWFEEVFDEDYLRTLPFMSADQTLREVEFIEESLGVKPGGQVLDVGCGYGRHAIELVQRGLDVTGLDLSLPLLLRAADEAQKRAVSVNFVHADMREMAFEKQFDGIYCMLTSFGYFDEETNLRVAEGIGRALKPGGRFLLDLVNRDYVAGDLPSRVWWEGNGCVVLEEVDFNFHTSRILTHRSIVFEDGRQIEQEISVRAYSLHEIGRLLRQAGFRVLDISGSLATRGHFFGGTSRSLLILAEKRTDDT